MRGIILTAVIALALVTAQTNKYEYKRPSIGGILYSSEAASDFEKKSDGSSNFGDQPDKVHEGGGFKGPSYLPPRFEELLVPSSSS